MGEGQRSVSRAFAGLRGLDESLQALWLLLPTLILQAHHLVSRWPESVAGPCCLNGEVGWKGEGDWAA